MAFQMAYNDELGNSYPSSYWRVMEIAVSLPNESARAVFLGWKDALSVGVYKPIGQKEYNINGAAFQSYLAAYLGGQTDLFALAYALAPQTKDVPGPPDQDGAPTSVSFFENASLVG
jgi:hypothetical protein